MTVSTNPFRSGPHVGDSATTTFNITFTVRDSAALAVYVKDTVADTTSKKVLGVDYTYAANAVTFTTAPLSTEEVLILSEEAYDQETDFTLGSSVDLASIQQMADSLSAQIKQLEERLDRALTLDKFSTLSELEFASPEAADNNKALTYDSTTQAYKHAEMSASGSLVSTAFGESILAAANDAGARTLLGLVLGTDIVAKSVYDAHVASTTLHNTPVILSPVQPIVDLTTDGNVSFQSVTITTNGDDTPRFAIVRARLFIKSTTATTRSVTVRFREAGDINTGSDLVSVVAQFDASSGSNPTGYTINVDRTVIVPVTSSGRFEYEIQQVAGVTTNEIELIQEGYFT